MAESAIPDACQLYRHFDAQGDLLYVGMSLSAVNRLSGHKSASKWFAEIARVEVENFASREEAAFAEDEAIILENPRYNIAGMMLQSSVSHMSKEIIQAIGRLRRAQPRNEDTLLVCEELERRLCAPKSTSSQTNCKVCEARKATTRNRVARHRKRRAEGKDNG